MKKDDTYKDKGLRVAVQHKNDTAGKMTLSEDFTDRLMQRIEQQDEKPVQHRMKFWPWIAAACVAAFLVVLLAPPRKEAITEPQIAKVEPKAKSVEVKTAEPEERHLSQAISPIQQSHRLSQANEIPTWQYEDELMRADACLTHQMEIKEKGERLDAYIHQQTTIDIQY